MEMIQQISAIAAVFGLLAAAVWLLRRGGVARFTLPRLGEGRRQASLESIERLALTPQHALHLVKIGGRELVVATHPQGCALLLDANRDAE